MTMTIVIVLNALLDLGIVLGLAAVTATPFRLDRRKPTLGLVEAPSTPELLDVDLAA